MRSGVDRVDARKIQLQPVVTEVEVEQRERVGRIVALAEGQLDQGVVRPVAVGGEQTRRLGRDDSVRCSENRCRGSRQV